MHCLECTLKDQLLSDTRGVTVSAVIPTTGRVELRRAVESVSRQTVPVEAVVVLDDPTQEEAVKSLLGGLNYELVITSGSLGGGGARNAGVSQASGSFIAFLDDDDEWLPHKTVAQLRLLKSTGADVVSSRTNLTGTKDRIVPEVRFVAGMQMANYLLERRTLRLRRTFMQTSSLLVRRELVMCMPWDEGLRKHQDWDWLIRAHTRGLRIEMHEDVLVNVFQHSVGSVSKVPDWRTSERWLETLDGLVSSRAAADFTAAISLRSAVRARDWQAAFRLLKRAVQGGCHPAALAVAILEVVRKQ